MPSSGFSDKSPLTSMTQVRAFVKQKPQHGKKRQIRSAGYSRSFGPATAGCGWQLVPNLTGSGFAAHFVSKHTSYQRVSKSNLCQLIAGVDALWTANEHFLIRYFKTT
jgi:hypothetical protein